MKCLDITKVRYILSSQVCHRAILLLFVVEQFVLIDFKFSLGKKSVKLTLIAFSLPGKKKKYSAQCIAYKGRALACLFIPLGRQKFKIIIESALRTEKNQQERSLLKYFFFVTKSACQSRCRVQRALAKPNHWCVEFVLDSRTLIIIKTGKEIKPEEGKPTFSLAHEVKSGGKKRIKRRESNAAKQHACGFTLEALSFRKAVSSKAQICMWSTEARRVKRKTKRKISTLQIVLSSQQCQNPLSRKCRVSTKATQKIKKVGVVQVNFTESNIYIYFFLKTFEV